MTNLKNIFLSIIILTGISILHSTSFEISGNISADTTWTGVDTVKVVGNIYVDNGKTLTIDPGIYAEFQGHYKIQVYGTLLAVGTASERITFTAADQQTGWNRLVFNTISPSNDSTRIVYCILKYGRGNDGGALFIKNFDKILVSNCLFSNNYAEDNGGAIYIYQSDLELCSNVIINNESNSQGGGISFQYNSDALIINNTICDNNALGGGGIYCRNNCDPTIINTIIYDNTAEFNGNQVFLSYDNSDPDFYYPLCQDDTGHFSTLI